MATATATPKAANVRVVHDSLAEQIESNRLDMRNRKCFPIGKMLQLFIGPDDQARYMQNATVRDRIASISKARGLQLDWGQDAAPNISWNQNHSSILFPFGCLKPPRVSDPRVKGATTRTISQDVTDYASGYVAGKDGSTFVILQPVLFLGVWIMDGLYKIVGHPDPVSGRYPTLLISAKTSETHIIYGALELTSASSGATYKPWEHPDG